MGNEYGACNNKEQKEDEPIESHTLLPTTSVTTKKVLNNSVSDIIPRCTRLSSKRDVAKRCTKQSLQTCKRKQSESGASPSLSFGSDNEDAVKKHQSSNATSSLKRKRFSLLDGYKSINTLKNSHFEMYEDMKHIKPKERSIVDIANDKHIAEKIYGWKILEIDKHIESLIQFEMDVAERLTGYKQIFQSKFSDGDRKDTRRALHLFEGIIHKCTYRAQMLADANERLSKIKNHKTHIQAMLNKFKSKNHK